MTTRQVDEEQHQNLDYYSITLFFSSFGLSGAPSDSLNVCPNSSRARMGFGEHVGGETGDGGVLESGTVQQKERQ